MRGGGRGVGDFAITNFEGAHLKYDNSFFKLLPKNKKIRHLGLKLWHFCFFLEVLEFDKFEGADFKYDNSFLKLLPKNNQTNNFWSKF